MKLAEEPAGESGFSSEASKTVANVLGPIMLEPLEGRDEALEIFGRNAFFFENGDVAFIDRRHHGSDLVTLLGEAQADHALVLDGALIVEIATFDQLGDGVAEIGPGIVSPDPQ